MEPTFQERRVSFTFVMNAEGPRELFGILLLGHFCSTPFMKDLSNYLFQQCGHLECYFGCWSYSMLQCLVAQFITALVLRALSIFL